MREVLRRSIYNPSLVNQKNENGTTPLMYAMQEALPEIAIALIQCGADPQAKDNEGQTIFHYNFCGQNMMQQVWYPFYKIRSRKECYELVMKEWKKIEQRRALVMPYIFNTKQRDTIKQTN